jgi:Acyl-CoA dehydrogenase, N-terminal domain
VGRLARTEGLTEPGQDILATVRDFTAREIIPVAAGLEHADEYPARIVEGMRQLGLSGLTIGEAYGGLGASLLLYALVVEEIARGWMPVPGIIRAIAAEYLVHQDGRGMPDGNRTRLIHASCGRELQARTRRRPAPQPATPSGLA